MISNPNRIGNKNNYVTVQTYFDSFVIENKLEIETFYYGATHNNF